MRLQAMTDSGISVVYGDDPNGVHGRFVELRHSEYGKNYNDDIFFSIDERLGIETNDTPVQGLPQRGGIEWFWECIQEVFEEYGISQDIYDRIFNELSY